MALGDRSCFECGGTGYRNECGRTVSCWRDGNADRAVAAAYAAPSTTAATVPTEYITCLGRPCRACSDVGVLDLGLGLHLLRCDCTLNLAVHDRSDEGLGVRCDDCAPDACKHCFTWGRAGCAIHREVIPFEIERAFNGQHEMCGAVPTETNDDVDTVRINLQLHEVA